MPNDNTPERITSDDGGTQTFWINSTPPPGIATTLKRAIDEHEAVKGEVVSLEPAVALAKTIAGRTPGLDAQTRAVTQKWLDAVKQTQVSKTALKRILEQVRQLNVNSKIPTVFQPVTFLRFSDRETNQLWNAILDLDSLQTPWLLIGGQMVNLHCYSARIERSRVTNDADLAVDVWVHRNGLNLATRKLRSLGFNESDVDLLSERNTAHRYQNGDIQFDVVIPEGTMRQRHRPTTYSGKLGVEIVGANRAFRHGQRIPVDVDGRTGFVSTPSLYGAIALKSAAVLADRNAYRHRLDLADLLHAASYEQDIFSLLDQIDTKDAKTFRKVLPEIQVVPRAQPVKEALLRASGTQTSS